MSKETIKMNSIRITRIGIKKALCDAEWAANCHRNVLRDNWNKDDDKEVRKALKHDIRTNAINEHIGRYNQTGLLG